MPPKPTAKSTALTDPQDDDNLAQTSMLKGHGDVSAVNNAITANREDIKFDTDMVTDLSDQVSQANTKIDQAGRSDG
jgi:hypothetical protein